MTFSYRDNRTGQIKHCTTSARDFIARFLQHVLPRNFTKVRHYGFYSPSRKADLQHARTLLGAPAPEPSSAETPTATTMDPPRPCPSCTSGHLHVVGTMASLRLQARAPP